VGRLAGLSHRKSFCKSQFPHRSVNLVFILVMLRDKLTHSCGDGLVVIGESPATIRAPSARIVAGLSPITTSPFPRGRLAGTTAHPDSKEVPRMTSSFSVCLGSPFWCLSGEPGFFLAPKMMVVFCESGQLEKRQSTRVRGCWDVFHGGCRRTPGVAPLVGITQRASSRA